MKNSVYFACLMPLYISTSSYQEVVPSFVEQELVQAAHNLELYGVGYIDQLLDIVDNLRIDILEYIDQNAALTQQEKDYQKIHLAEHIPDVLERLARFYTQAYTQSGALLEKLQRISETLRAVLEESLKIKQKYPALLGEEKKKDEAVVPAEKKFTADSFLYQEINTCMTWLKQSAQSFPEGQVYGYIYDCIYFLSTNVSRISAGEQRKLAPLVDQFIDALSAYAATLHDRDRRTFWHDMIDRFKTWRIEQLPVSSPVVEQPVAVKEHKVQKDIQQVPGKKEKPKRTSRRQKRRRLDELLQDVPKVRVKKLAPKAKKEFVLEQALADIPMVEVKPLSEQVAEQELAAEPVQELQEQEVVPAEQIVDTGWIEDIFTQLYQALFDNNAQLFAQQLAFVTDIVPALQMAQEKEQFVERLLLLLDMFGETKRLDSRRWQELYARVQSLVEYII